VYLKIFQVRGGVPYDHYCIHATGPRHPRALIMSNQNIYPHTDIEDIGDKKHTAKNSS
jgi:hypothetical protein